MEIVQKIMLVLLKDFSRQHTITSLASMLKMSRVGVWKVLKRMEAEKYINLIPVGSGTTSTYTIHLNWDNFLVEKNLALSLAEEASTQRRWRANFAELENEVDFLILFGSILHSPKIAGDIDLLGVISSKKNFHKTQKITDKTQLTLTKKLHLLCFTSLELKQELMKTNPALIDAIAKGIVLYGQENFIKFIKELNPR